jgi:hypothetical protein
VPQPVVEAVPADVSRVPSNGNDQAPGSVRLAARRERPLESKPLGVLALDLDGDGADEVLATILEPGGVLELHLSASNASARHASPKMLARLTSYPLRAVVVRGLDRPVLATAERLGARLTVFAPDDFQAPILQRKLDSPPRALDAMAIGGTWCVAVACDGGELVLEREGAPPIGLKLAGDLPRAVRLLEDGQTIAIAYQDARSLVACAIEGGEREPRELLTRSLPGLPRDIVESDLDLDGDLELVVAGGEDSLWVFGFDRAGGARGWIESGEPPLEWKVGNVPVDLEVVDLDRDGKDEIIAVCSASLTAETLGDFTRSGPGYRSSVYAGQTPLDCCAGDFDGDGELDLALANRDSLAVGFLSGKGARSFHSVENTSVGSFPNRLTHGNLLGDHHPEVATLNGKEGSITVVEVAGESTHEIDLPDGVLPIAAAVADFSSEGDASAHEELAVFVEGHGPGRCDLYRGPALEPVAGFALPGGCTDAHALDCDRDQRPDLLVVDAQSERLWVLRNRMGVEAQADPPFELVLELALSSGPCALESFELGGKQAIAVALGGPGPRMGFARFSLEGSGEGGIALVEEEFYGVEGTPVDLAAGDLDGDGREDLAVVATQGPDSPLGFVQVFLRREDGFGVLAPKPCGLKPRHVAAGDLDLDGKAEIAVAAQNSHAVSLLRLTPAGALERLDDVGAGLGCLDLALLDVDLDGALDLLVANAFSNDLSAAMNQSRPR